MEKGQTTCVKGDNFSIAEIQISLLMHQSKLKKIGPKRDSSFSFFFDLVNVLHYFHFGSFTFWVILVGRVL
jgi:hypothetical protein